MFCVRILPSICGFQCGSDFFLIGLLFAFKVTSSLRDLSRVCEVSIVDLSKMIPDLIPNIPKRPTSHETYKCYTTELSLPRKASSKSSRSKMITQGKSKSLVDFAYETSNWGMSTLALPFLFVGKSGLQACETPSVAILVLLCNWLMSLSDFPPLYDIVGCSVDIPFISVRIKNYECSDGWRLVQWGNLPTHVAVDDSSDRIFHSRAFNRVKR